MRKQTSIPALRSHSPEDLLLRLQISSAFTAKHKRTDSVQDNKPAPLLASDYSNASSTPSNSCKATDGSAYLGLSRVSKSPQPRITSSSVMKLIPRETIPFQPAPSQPQFEAANAKEKANLLWAKGTARRAKLAVKSKQNLLKGTEGIKPLADLYDSFKSIVELVTANQMLQAKWFSGEGRLEAIANLAYLDRLAANAAQSYLETASVGKTLSKTPDPIRLEEVKTTSPTMRAEPVRAQSSLACNIPVPAVEIAQLENHVALLAEKLHQLQNDGSAGALQAKLDAERSLFAAQLATLKAQLQAKETILAVTQNQLGQAKDQLAASQAALKDVKVLSFQRSSQLSASHKLIADLEDQRTALESRLKMLLEDCYRFGVLIEDLALWKEKYREVNVKFTKLEMDIQAGTVGFAGDGAAVVNLKDPIFTIIQPSVFLPKSREKPKRPQGVPGSLFTSGTDINVDTTEVDLARFRLPKPSFATLIGADIPDVKAALAELPFPLWLEATIRGIYDSKYSEHLLCSSESGRTRSSFPEFVYCWLGQYTIDERKREIINLDWSLKDQIGARRFNLLLALSTDKAKKAWEVWTFREFLLENLDLDQLSFFLHCRQMLLRGPQLHYNSGKYAVIHYVPIAHVNAVLDKLMAKMSASDRGLVKGMVLDKARDRSGVLHVDCSYVLRILLIYYEREKKAKFKTVEELFEMAPKVDIKHQKFVDFASFKQICLNLCQELLDNEIVSLYRTTWMLSKGEITAESLFLAANETNFLSKCLRLGGFWPVPVLNAYSEIELGVSPFNNCFATTISDWRAQSKHLELLKEGVMRMGLLPVAAQLPRLESVLKRKGSLPLEETAGRHIGEVYLRIWLGFCQAALVHLELYGPVLFTRSEEQYAESVLGLGKDLQSGCSTFRKDLHAMKVAKFVLKLAVNRIQRIWKAKKQERRRRRRTEAKGL